MYIYYIWGFDVYILVLTVNFRQPSHEFTFNVDIDLLF
jgi:hypothetical protein